VMGSRIGGGGAGIDCRKFLVGVLGGGGGGGGVGAGGLFRWYDSVTSAGGRALVEGRKGVGPRNEMGMINRRGYVGERSKSMLMSSTDLE